MASQQTLAIIKPDGVERQLIGKIIDMCQVQGLKCVAMKMKQLAPHEAHGFYAVHQDRPFFSSLIEYICRGPVVIMVLEGDNAVQVYRQVMGATKPEEAAERTIRALYGKNILENTVHGSDSLDNAALEISYFFADLDIYGQS